MFRIQKNSGYTMVEILMALGILSIGAIGIMQMAQVQTNVQTRAKAMLGTTQIINTVQKHIASYRGCENTFGNINTGFANGMTINPIRTVTGGVLAEIGKPLYPNDPARQSDISSVVVEGIRVVDRNFKDNGNVRTYSFNLELEVDGVVTVNNGPDVKKKIIKLPFPIQIRKLANSNNHDTCLTEGVLAIDIALKDLCESFAGVGAYDPNDKSCDLVNFGTPINDFTLLSVNYFKDYFDSFISEMNNEFAQDNQAATINGSLVINGKLLKTAGSLNAATDAITKADVTKAQLKGIKCIGNGIGFVQPNGSIACVDAECPSGEYLKGFLSNGQKICVALVDPLMVNKNCVGLTNGELALTANGSVTLDCK